MNNLERFIADVEARVRAASHGKWTASDAATSHFEVTTDSSDHFWVAECQNQRDTDFIAHAPTDLAKAVAALKIMEKALRLSCVCPSSLVFLCHTCRKRDEVEEILK